MSRRSMPGRALRLLGAGVVAVFVLGSASGPLRTCFIHLGHSSGDAHAHRVADASPNVGGHSGDSPEPAQQGCSCLGLCSIEDAPLLASGHLVSAVHVPPVPRKLTTTSVSTPVHYDPLDLPLARPPPTVA